jgi:peptidoglycan hydrolase-like protein with peptidoglycan-binding domain
MYVFGESLNDLESWIRDEVTLPGTLDTGARGMAVKRAQEWLNLHGFGLVIDSDYGPITADAVIRYQTHVGLPSTGVVDGPTFGRLVQPMVTVLNRNIRSADGLGDVVLDFARAHLEQHPREMGGQNRGPWVRLYMRGQDGPQWAWCAGFVTFVMHQAADALGVPAPIEGTFSCDTLAAQGSAAGRFRPEGAAAGSTLPRGSIFLNRRTATDWVHTGLVTEATDTVIRTIEGNTNDDGSREGYEVCARSRGFASKDFVLLG